MSSARDFALNSLRRGNAPGRPDLYSRPAPGSDRIGGPPRYRGFDDSSNTNIVHHYLVKPWADGHHKRLKPGDLAFVWKTSSPGDGMHTIVELFKFNDLLRMGWQLYKEEGGKEIEPSSSRTLNPGDDVALSLHFDVPSERELYGKYGAKKRFDGKVPLSREIAEYLQKENIPQGLRQYYGEYLLSVKRKEARQIKTIKKLNKYKDKDFFVYATKAGILDRWNFLGGIQNTDNDTGERFDPQKMLTIANVVVQKRCRVYNRWSSELEQGTRLYLIMKRRRIGKREWGEFQVTPYFSTSGTPPSLEDIKYKDIGGNWEYGKVWNLGYVYEALLGTRPQSSRNRSLGLSGISQEEAYEAKGKLDFVVFQYAV